MDARSEGAGALVARVHPRTARLRVRNHASFFSSSIFPPSPSEKLYRSSACQPRPAPLHPKSRFGKQYVSFARDGALEIHLIHSVPRSSSPPPPPSRRRGGARFSHTRLSHVKLGDKKEDRSRCGLSGPRCGWGGSCPAPHCASC